METTITKRKLPHIYPIGASFFVTFRLANSVPDEVLADLKTQKEKQATFIQNQSNPDTENSLYDLEKRFFAFYDAMLDKYSNPNDFLRNDKVAQIVASKFIEFDGVFYDLVAYCIMSNHVHILIDTANYISLLPHHTFAKTMQYIKGGSARLCNQLLGRQGDFWAEESYDHYVRNLTEKDNIIKYILNNPIKAGLVKNWEDYPFSYCSNGL